MLLVSEISSLVRIHRSILQGVTSLTLVLIPGTYGYSPKDIIILKDDPDLSDLFQPTRVNMVCQPYSLFSCVWR